MKMKSNIFFLVIDSLRQDKCLGKSNSSATPNLDKLIQNGTFFNQNQKCWFQNKNCATL